MSVRCYFCVKLLPLTLKIILRNVVLLSASFIIGYYYMQPPKSPEVEQLSYTAQQQIYRRYTNLIAGYN